MQNVGGQAVIEGVMMRSGGNWTVAVRALSGDIEIKRERLGKLPKFLKFPLIRGVVALVQALSLGIRAIEFSASKAYGETEKEEQGKLVIASTIVFALILGVCLFILLPLYATKLVGTSVEGISRNSLLFNLTDGVFRVSIFLLYILLIGRWKEMARIFMYHGAEHKVIHAYEQGRELTVENAREFSTLHPRCGTSFLMIVMVVSILVFSFIPQHWFFAFKFLSRLVLVPIIAGSSFELLKLSAKFKDNRFINVMIRPGLMLQRLTTREPDDAQLEVAVHALREVLELERQNAR